MAGDQAYEIQTIDRLIACLNHGDEGAEATRLYREIMERGAQMQADHGGTHKAELTIKIKFSFDPKGVDVAIVPSAKIPPRPTTKERFFVSEKGTLTMQDPARDSMFPGADLGRRRAMPEGTI